MICRLLLSTYLIYEEPAMQAIEHLKPHSVDCLFTSPNPPRSDAEVSSLVEFFKKFQTYIKDTGVAFVELGDYHNKRGELGGIPHYFFMAMKAEGWTMRSTLIWYRKGDKSKMEDTMRFRRDCEFIFMFAPDKNHFFNDRLGMQETSLISVPPEQVRKTEFKSGFPEEVVRYCIIPTTKPQDIILDPFAGTSTTGVVALKNGRHYIGFEIKKGYKELAEKRLSRFGIKELEDEDEEIVTQTIECGRD